MAKRKKRPTHKLQHDVSLKAKLHTKKGKKGLTKNSKRQPETKTWVESCAETKAENTPKAGCRMVVFVSRVELVNGRETSLVVPRRSECGKLPSKIDGAASETVVPTPDGDGGSVKDVPAGGAPNDTLLKDGGSCENGSDDRKGAAQDGAEDAPGAEKTPVETKEDIGRSFVIVVHAPSARRKPKTDDKKRKRTPIDANSKSTPNLTPIDPTDAITLPQRCRRLFSRYDEGIRLDRKSSRRFSTVPPEAIADHVAARVSAEITPQGEGIVVLDVFGGCGGSAIAFARQSGIATVVCVDVDRDRLRMAAHNAGIYGVDPQKILFIEADAARVLEKYRGGTRLPDVESVGHGSDSAGDAAVEEETCGGYIIGGPHQLPSTLDTVYLSPPWSGTNDRNDSVAFDVASHTLDATAGAQDDGDPIDGEHLLDLAARASWQRSVVYFLPRSIDGIKLGRSARRAGYTGRYELEQNVVDGKLDAVTGYFHDRLVKPR